MNLEILLTLKLGKNEYIITSDDKFCANSSNVTLLSRAKINPELKAKHIKQINQFERVQHDHKFGSMISIFSLKAKSTNNEK